jgi:DNA polymerase-3 subunit beta
MHFTINNADFQRGLRKIDPAISKRPTTHAHASITLDAIQPKTFPSVRPFLRISGEYPDGYVKYRAPVLSVAEYGSVAVDAGVLASILRRLPRNAVVTVRKVQDKGKVVIEAGDFSLELDANHPDPIPARYETGQGASFAVPVTDLARLFRRTQKAMADHRSSKYLNVVFLHTKSGRLRAVATNGHWLSLTSVPLPDKAGDVEGITVPRSTVLGVLKVLKGVSGFATISVSDDLVCIGADRVEIFLRSVDGFFPKYEYVIPGEGCNQKVVTVNTKGLADLLDRIIPALDRKQPVVGLDISKNSIVVSNAEIGSVGCAGKVEANSNISNMKIFFNAKYLLDALSVIEGEHARFEIKDQRSPVIILDPKDEYTLHLIMPWA